MTTPRHRRNAIVLHETAPSHFILARVVRRIDADHVEVISTLGRTHVAADDRLTPQSPDQALAVIMRDRQGLPPLVRPMPSLRRLKQNAAWYHPQVWRRDRRSAARRAFDGRAGA